MSALLRIQSVKLAKDVRQFILRDTNAGVDYLDLNALFTSTYAQQNAALIGVSQGVTQQITQYAGQQIVVGMHQLLRGFHLEFEAFRFCLRGKFGGHVVNQIINLKVIEHRLYESGFQFGDINQRTDQ